MYGGSILPGLSKNPGTGPQPIEVAMAARSDGSCVVCAESGPAVSAEDDSRSES